MDEKKALALRLKALEKYFEKKRRTWFLGIWLGYSAVIFIVFLTRADIDNILEFVLSDTLIFLGDLLASAVLGLISFVINACVWSLCCNSIRDTTDLMKDLEKEYNQMP